MVNRDKFLHELKEIATLRRSLINIQEKILKREEDLFNSVYDELPKEKYIE